jgi:hypothetical protein
LSSCFRDQIKYSNRLDESYLAEVEKEIKKAGTKKRFLPSEKGKVRDAIKLMLSLDYKPPDHPGQIASHLRVLWVMYTYYFHFIVPPSLYDMHLDIACCKLKVKANSLFTRISRDIKEYERINKSVSGKQKKKLVKQQLVLETYHEMDPRTRNDMTKNSIAKHIEKCLTGANGKKLVVVSTNEPSPQQAAGYQVGFAMLRR